MCVSVSWLSDFLCNGAALVRDVLTRRSLAYGGGVQFRFGAFATRLEYDAVDSKSQFGTPALISVGVTWTP